MLFNNLFDYDLNKVLEVNVNYDVTISKFEFNVLENVDELTNEKTKQYNFRIEGETSLGHKWTDVIFPIPVRNRDGEITGNVFTIMLKSLQRQLAPNEDWTVPKTKVKFNEWLTARQAQIVGATVKAHQVANGSYINKKYFELPTLKNTKVTF